MWGTALTFAGIDAIITTDERGIIQPFNVGAERMLGYKIGTGSSVRKRADMAHLRCHRTGHYSRRDQQFSFS